MMARSGKWLLPVPVVLLVTGLAACGTKAAPPGAGTAQSLNLSLTTVPTTRSSTVSTPTAQIGDCHGGLAGNDTKSTSKKLGFPDGKCSYGKPGANGIFPITITNTGIASDIYVSGSSAIPEDNGTGWRLCNVGEEPVGACTGRKHLAPGTGQYLVRIFSPVDKPNYGGLTDTPSCDHVFPGSTG